MTVAFSTSSPVASVAVIAADGSVLWEGGRASGHQAGGVCLEMLEQARSTLGFAWDDVSLFAADMGPGSFTGTRVGVILAKTLAFLGDRPVVGASSFDLIDPSGTVVLPNKRNEYFVRLAGQEPIRTPELPSGPFKGFGPGIESEVYPSASLFSLLPGLNPQSAISFVPEYLVDPSISIPKKPYVLQEAKGA